MNIALLSPNQNAYSETFIQAHKNLLKGKVFYYYGEELPNKLEGGLVINSRKRRILDIIKGHFCLNRFSLEEQALITSFKKYKIDLVLAEYGGTGEKIIPVCRELNLPFIVHFHGFDASISEIIKIKKKYKKVFDNASYVVVVSKKMYRDLLNWGCPQNKLVYNVCGPNEKFFEVKPKFSKQQFISIGRFVDKKAPYYLILSFLKIIEEFPEAKLIMAGNGQLLNSCQNLIRFYNLEANVKLVGVITPEKYREYLEESLAVVQHSITAENGDSEGTPVGILEASAAGLPVISTNHAGIPDVIINGKTGFLSEEHDIQEMADNMLKFLKDKNLAKSMGKSGKENISKNFTLEKHIDKLNELIGRAAI